MKENYKYMMTVIIPSYNNGEYIADAIDSILMQDIDFSLQIIISDDASTDNSASIIRKYVNDYPDVILALYSEKNMGLFENYYKAIKHMNSKYFCVLDPDDYYIDKKRLKKAFDFLEQNSEYTIYAMNSFAYDVKLNKEYKIYYSDMPLGERHISSFDDFLNNKAMLCNTPGTTFRNVVYTEKIIRKITEVSMDVSNKAAFRADSGRNVLHLTKGKAMFVNDFVARYRIHDHNIAQRKKRYENLIQLAQSYIIYNRFFDGKYIDKFYDIVFSYYRKAIISYGNELYNMNNIMSFQQESYTMFQFVQKWLQQEKKSAQIEENKFYNIRLLSELNNKKIIVWGTGISARRLIKEYYIRMKQDDFFIDGTYKCGQFGNFLDKNVYAFEDAQIDESCCIIICCSYYREILEKIQKNSACSSSQIINLFAYDMYYGDIK